MEDGLDCGVCVDDFLFAFLAADWVHLIEVMNRSIWEPHHLVLHIEVVFVEATVLNI